MSVLPRLVTPAFLAMLNAKQVLGPQIFLAWDGPRYFIAFATHLGCYSLLILVTLGLRWYLLSQNKTRDEIASAGVEEANDEDMVRAWEDLTDNENLSFRYVY